jgi:hypothetical protein
MYAMYPKLQTASLGYCIRHRLKVHQSTFSHSKQKKGKTREFVNKCPTPAPAPESYPFNPSYVLYCESCVGYTRSPPKVLHSRGSPSRRFWCRRDKSSCFLPLGDYSSSVALQSPSPYPSPPRVSSQIS